MRARSIGGKDMKVFNTLTRKKEDLQTIEPMKIRMYVCGPTVYDFIHIGNARPMIVFDTFRRYMTFLGYEVNYVQPGTLKKAIEEKNNERYTRKKITDKRAAAGDKTIEKLIDEA